MEHIKLIHDITWKYFKMYRNDSILNFEYKELFSEACLGYAEALNSYDSSSGVKFITHARHIMRGKLYDFTIREGKRGSHYTTYLESKSAVTYQPESFSLFLDDLPEDCKNIAKIILAHVDEFPNAIDCPKKARSIVVNLLRAEGWSWAKIWEGIRKMKILLS